ncbi:MAG: class I SAM-dependent methyltransferase [Myxococcota bacterium]|nr:class I SAM-dependent methyltransferase [Myxococcota bacterium]
MASLLQRIKVAKWFLERRELYPEFLRYTRSRIRSLGIDRDQEARDATARCASLQVDPQTALTQILGHRPPPVDELLREELARARATLQELPVKMHGAGNLDLIYHLAEYVEATRAIETGVSAGWSSLAFLLSLAKRGGKLASTDMPYPGSTKEAARYVGAVVPDELRAHWKLIPEPDGTALPKALAGLPEIDICHYDSDKSYDGRMWAYRLLWRALRPGGVMISDDIDDNFGFFHFCGEVQQRAVVVRVDATKGHKYIGIVFKAAG